MKSVAALPSDVVSVGRVLGGYGVRGWLRIEAFNDPADSVLLKTPRWFIQRAVSGLGQLGVNSGARLAGAFPAALPAEAAVEGCKVHGAVLVAKLAGIDVKELAEALRGCEVAVRRVDFPEPEDDEFYWVDLIGCTVTTPRGVLLGEVVAVDHHGAHPLLRLRIEEEGERLIPFVAAHVLEVDVTARRIVADWDPDF